MMKSTADMTSELSAISQAVNNLPRNTPFLVPPSYFETFVEKIKQRIDQEEMSKTSEIEIHSPLLQSMKKENPYSLPQDYFQDFHVNYSKSEGKIIPLFRARNIIRYAAAACITGILISLFLSSDFNINQQLTAGSTEMHPSDLSSDAVETYLSYIDGLGVEAGRDDFVETEGNSLVDISRETIGQILSELSESGIDQYMNPDDINENKILLN